MKKGIALFLALVMVFALCACGKSDASKHVEALIDAIGDVSKDSATVIANAREAYDALTEKERKSIKNYAVLENKEALLGEILAPLTKFESFVRNNPYESANNTQLVNVDLLKEYAAQVEKLNVSGFKVSDSKYDEYVQLVMEIYDTLDMYEYYLCFEPTADLLADGMNFLVKARNESNKSNWDGTATIFVAAGAKFGNAADIVAKYDQSQKNVEDYRKWLKGLQSACCAAADGYYALDAKACSAALNSISTLSSTYSIYLNDINTFVNNLSSIQDELKTFILE